MKKAIEKCGMESNSLQRLLRAAAYCTSNLGMLCYVRYTKYVYSLDVVVFISPGRPLLYPKSKVRAT